MTNELITYNLERHFLAEIKNLKNLRIISPFIKKGIIASFISKKISVLLLTRLK